MSFRWKKMDFISEIDQLFAQWDKSHNPSNSQVAEIEKYQKLNTARDHKQASITNSPLSDDDKA